MKIRILAALGAAFCPLLAAAADFSQVDFHVVAGHIGWVLAALLACLVAAAYAAGRPSGAPSLALQIEAARRSQISQSSVLLLSMVVFFAMVGCKGFSAAFVVPGVAAVALIALAARKKKVCRTRYSLAGEAADAMEALRAAAQEAFASKELGGIDACGVTDSMPPKGVGKSYLAVSSDVQAPYIVADGSAAWFLPDGLFLQAKSVARFIAWKDVRIKEAESLQSRPTPDCPSDARFAGEHWEHARKDGSPDPRFEGRNARVYRYVCSCVELMVPGGTIAFAFSNPQAGKQFAAALARVCGHA